MAQGYQAYRRMLLKRDLGEQMGPGQKQLLALWVNPGLGIPSGHTYPSNGLCVACNHREARVQLNCLQAPQMREATQPGWGVRSLAQRATSPEAQRQQNGEQTAAI